MGRATQIRFSIRIAAVCLTMGMVGFAQDVVPQVTTEQLENRMLDQVNQEREKEGLPKFQWNDKLKQSAMAHAARISSAKMLSHRFPDEPELRERVAAKGLHFDSVAENLAFDMRFEELHEDLMQSSGHRANILSSKYNSIGIAIAVASNGLYAVQNFARITSNYSPDEAEHRLIEAMMKAAGHAFLEIKANRSVRQGVCDMAAADKLDASKMPGGYSARAAIAYTASEPDDLPDEVRKLAKRANAPPIIIGVCYRASKSHPGGIYWIGVGY